VLAGRSPLLEEKKGVSILGEEIPQRRYFSETGSEGTSNRRKKGGGAHFDRRQNHLRSRKTSRVSKSFERKKEVFFLVQDNCLLQKGALILLVDREEEGIWQGEKKKL